MSDVVIADFDPLRAPLCLSVFVAKIWATKAQRRKGARRVPFLILTFYFLLKFVLESQE